MFSSRDWGFFPRYWFHPIKITILQTYTNDIAINFGDITKSKFDRFRKRHFNGRIEESQFPNLNYRKWPFFSVPNGTHHSIIRGGTYSVGDHPVIVLGQGAEFKLMDTRVEAKAKGYPRERALIWFFTDPCNRHLITHRRAKEEAVQDFWHTLGSIVFSKLDDILMRDLTPKIVDVFLDSINRLQKEYHSLITREDLIEQRLQNFLENHFFLLDPHRSFTMEKRKIGNYLADFVLKYSDGNITLVEIQLNNDPILKNEALSEGFKEAVQQIQSWFKWLEENEPMTLSKCSGLIVIGHKHSYKENQKIIEKILSSLTRPTRLITYDDLENSFDQIRTLIQSKVKN